jgi:hypothetical protein
VRNALILTLESIARSRVDIPAGKVEGPAVKVLVDPIDGQGVGEAVGVPMVLRLSKRVKIRASSPERSMPEKLVSDGGFTWSFGHTRRYSRASISFW